MEYAEEIVIKHDEKVVACSQDQKEDFPDATVINVEVFGDREEAEEHFSQNAGVDEEGEVISDGTDEILGLINSAHRANCMNRARASHSRPKNTITQIRNIVKGGDKEAREKLAALAEELGLGELNL